MSAQVFNPMAISEFRRLVNHTNNNNNSSIDRIRRNLFGPVDRDESRALAERELAAIRRIDMENWSFDFAKEEPVNGPESKYVWERLTPDDVHESYALSRFEYLGMAAATNNHTTTVPSTPASNSVSTSERTKTQQQKQITDYFLASRRRPTSLCLTTSGAKKLSKSSKAIVRSLRQTCPPTKRSSRTLTSATTSSIRRS